MLIRLLTWEPDVLKDSAVGSISISSSGLRGGKSGGGVSGAGGGGGSSKLIFRSLDISETSLTCVVMNDCGVASTSKDP